MNFIKLIFMILRGHVQMDNIDDLEFKGSSWYKSDVQCYSLNEQGLVVTDTLGKPVIDESKVKKLNMFTSFLRKYGEMWYVQTALAVMYIPLTRWVHEIMYPEKEQDDRN